MCYLINAHEHQISEDEEKRKNPEVTAGVCLDIIENSKHGKEFFFGISQGCDRGINASIEFGSGFRYKAEKYVFIAQSRVRLCLDH